MFSALIPGYGVPKDILKDTNYNSYLSICFNTLFHKYHNQKGTIIFSGGYTDCYPPYQRTEAREMKRWFEQQKKIAEKACEKKLNWIFKTDNKSLTSVENIFNVKPFVSQKSNILIFCDATRALRMKKFATEILGKNIAKIIPVDFDTSNNRYKLDAIAWREKEDLRLSLKAVLDPKLLKIRREFAKRKLEIMREYGAEKGHEKLPEILKELNVEFKEKYSL